MNMKNKKKRLHFDILPSTQDYAKEKRSEGVDLIVTAAQQTGGKGTKGRSFSSQTGGVYLSNLTFYEDLTVKNAFQIMIGAAVAVCETLRFYGVKPLIKWPNDIWVNDKKICGILIENVLSGDRVRSSVVGIGLNVLNALPEDLSDIATTMRLEMGATPSVEEVASRLIDELGKERTMEEYRAYIGYMGREATLLWGDECVHGRLVSVDDEGGLQVEIDGKIRRSTAAEVSVRI
jgi:BirA family biotin operon repressor/biotin-[acetyl-CoA-carboxylase] ligase